MHGIEIVVLIVIGFLVPLLLAAVGGTAGALLGARQTRLETIDLGAVLGAILGAMAGLTIASIFADGIIIGARWPVPWGLHLPRLLVPMGVCVGTVVGCALMRAREPRILGIGGWGLLGGGLGGGLGGVLAFDLLARAAVPLVGASTILADQIAYLGKRWRGGSGDPSSPPTWVRAERVAALAVVLDFFIGDEMAIVFAGLRMGSGAGALVGGLGRLISRSLTQGGSINWIFSILIGIAGGALAGLRIRQLKHLGPVLAVLTMAIMAMAAELWLYGRSEWRTFVLLERAALVLAGSYALYWTVTAWARLRARR